MSDYGAWDWKGVRDRVIEAADTSRLLPRVRGPRGDMVGSWPEVISDYRESRTFRRRATPDAVSRMEEVLAWISNLSNAEDRRLLHNFGRLKVMPHSRIGRWCEENGWAERIFRRRVGLLCQGIADDLNRSRAMRLDADDCGLSENPAQAQPTALPSRNARFERAPDAKPSDLPEHPSRKAVVRRMQRWAAERSRHRAEADRL